MVALGLPGLDPDQVDARLVDPERVPLPGLGPRLEVHLEGRSRRPRRRVRSGSSFCPTFSCAGDEEVDDDVFERLVRVDVGEHPVDLDRVAGLRLEDGPGVLARGRAGSGRRRPSPGRPGRHVEGDLGVLGPRTGRSAASPRIKERIGRVMGGRPRRGGGRQERHDRDGRPTGHRNRLKGAIQRVDPFAYPIRSSPVGGPNAHDPRAQRRLALSALFLWTRPARRRRPRSGSKGSAIIGSSTPRGGSPPGRARRLAAGSPTGPSSRPRPLAGADVLPVGLRRGAIRAGKRDHPHGLRRSKGMRARRPLPARAVSAADDFPNGRLGRPARTVYNRDRRASAGGRVRRSFPRRGRGQDEAVER